MKRWLAVLLGVGAVLAPTALFLIQPRLGALSLVVVALAALAVVAYRLL